jgi:translation initiation factor 6 (eIF-6)
LEGIEMMFIKVANSIIPINSIVWIDCISPAIIINNRVTEIRLEITEEELQGIEDSLRYNIIKPHIAIKENQDVSITT